MNTLIKTGLTTPTPKGGKENLICEKTIIVRQKEVCFLHHEFNQKGNREKGHQKISIGLICLYQLQQKWVFVIDY